MMKASLNHIGIAVANAAGLQRLKKLFALLGLGIDHTEPVPEQGVVTHFLPLPKEQAALEKSQRASCALAKTSQIASPAHQWVPFSFSSPEYP